VNWIQIIVMLSGAKHPWLRLSGGLDQMIRGGKPGLADSVRCVTASLRSE
jgi:hypothetical protein